MSDTNAHNLKIKIETDEYLYWEYTEAGNWQIRRRTYRNG